MVRTKVFRPSSLVSSALFFFSIILNLPLATGAIDPLAAGPLPLNSARLRAVRATYDHGLIYKDADCFFTSEQIRPTEVSLTLLSPDVCNSRTQELVYLGKSNTLVACLSQKAEWAMKVVIGSNGIGKTKEGNRKSPFGTYWLGYPRHSSRFGIFIPVGYPNLSNIALGHTGTDIGIHGPNRGLHCHPEISLAKNWTAGCIAVGRDSQMIAISEWMLAHWPVKIVMTKD